jgi:predicted nuclease with TOPRIM domain
MNLVGKIFIVLILIMSVVFMAFSITVYATHKNWREAITNENATPDKPLGLAKQLQDAQKKNKELEDQKEKLTQQYNFEKAAKVQAVVKLETELGEMQKELKALELKAAELDKAKRTAEAAMNSTQTNATSFRTELESQRKTIREAQQDREKHFNEVVRLTDELNQAVNEREALKKRTDELAKDLAKADKVLRKFSLDKAKDYSVIPPTVEGIIRATPGANLVEISIGSDQGLLKGHKLEVYRTSAGQSAYVGRIEVVSLAPDRCVCKVDPNFQNSHMMVGDRVASKIE